MRGDARHENPQTPAMPKDSCAQTRATPSLQLSPASGGEGIEGNALASALNSSDETPLPSPPPLCGGGWVGVSAAARHINLDPAQEQRDDWKSHRKMAAECAQSLRKNQTEAERIFWNAVRDKRLQGYKFRRQFPVGPYYADFACLEAMLIVEIDGGQHSENKKDEIRTARLEKEGYAVLRFWNNDVLENIEGVLHTLLQQLESAHDPR